MKKDYFLFFFFISLLILSVPMLNIYDLAYRIRVMIVFYRGGVDAALFFNPYDEKEIINAVLQLEDCNLRNQLINKGSFLAKKYSTKNYIGVVVKTFDKASEIRECWE